MEEQIVSWFQEIAYNPNLVYATIVGVMVASSFGFPLPEEVTLMSAGFLSYMALNPTEFPPPQEGQAGVNVHVVAGVCLFSVFISDYLIYWLGKHFGPRVLELKITKRLFPQKKMDRVLGWVQKYGFWAPGVFRFTPGFRFPGHFSCGMLKVPTWKFIIIDGSASLLTVPIQVYAVAHYGKEILSFIKKWQMLSLGILVGIVILWFFIKWVNKKNLREN